ncbi:MAG: putative endonuclease 4 [Candidatus Doudnabacteria bacterium]|nr:putative endonuclease 4 [Candidatus Doudnabacteria bacterium]
MKIGCHVSIAGGIENAAGRAAEFGCETFQIFTRSPQGGKAPDIKESTIQNLKEEMQKHDISEFVVHAPYFINFGSIKKNIFYGSVAVVRDELERSSQLGARFLMTHLGTFKEIGEEKGMEQVIDGLQKVLKDYDGSTEFLLEIAAGAGEVIGDTFDELGRLSAELKKMKGFGGICLDTQHAFSSGYDLRTAPTIKKVFKDFDTKIGMEYLRMSHINDSKVELGGKKDRHDHIGEGHIGKTGFKEFLSFWQAHEKKTKDEKPLILETEHDKVMEDIKQLKAIRKSLKA